ncbi:MAG TPA: hypothetical protein VI300_02595 [Solirubrobacter sp.]
MTTDTANALDAQLPHFDAGTIQRTVVYATPQRTYDAIWSADLLHAPLARMLTRASIAIECAGARFRGTSVPPHVPRSARLRDMLGADSPWLLLADEPGREVVLGLLWTPPAGGHTCPADEFAEYLAPGLAKVVWSISVHPFGAGHTLLATETRTFATDALAKRRFGLLWPLIAPFAALMRSQVLLAIKREAEA